MVKFRRLIWLAVLVVGLSIVSGAAAREPHQPFHRTLGVHLAGSVAGVCAVKAPATTRRCTVQGERKIERVYGFGVYPHIPGHIVRFRLTSGRLSRHTESVKVRFRATGGGGGGASGQVSRWFDLPRGGRQLREFPVHVPFPPGSRIGLDVLVTGDGSGEASAPLAGAEGVLNLNAVFEQDDQAPPVLHFTYSKRQDFLRTRRVFVHVRSNEAGLLNPECSMVTHRVDWGLLFNQPHLKPNRPALFVCELEGRVVRAGRAALRAGRHPQVAIRLVAYDRAQNVTRTKTFYVLSTG